ncbi:TPA: isocitrate lyase/PEP mutase family protein [Yersinia enterocolitica]|uniref:isocitrate lyase/PEP mutase family protein n=1 Tax=Yersinia enterocolitica TaxID=630 RepID=UPI0021E7417E|nr:isocitrate lyase/phosphoenolpyruvate mutase family protein [Yersinia enterocolitica]EKN3946281.1 isocitrate lyase/phosphoenolpyruvate mutase family protein [Yersinia enterocolitica]EKN5071153.1 isocitrate lyase/phosphoenolpyruvate mutase family protein [Yersinia enterocolitica]EKN6315930.1 isocitrate lyase/phosphoenolpyruvate mutase family protein [Yersinia enterocolitica]UYJ95881.1 isocitrate lyase/phosphoenolpyruvate mutase family protein [Yersinia enterocolitica]HDL6672174.1 isocitrate l
MNFTELHNQKKPLLIANVWDAMSAMTAQQSGYQALGTSSAAIAATLGYEDGEIMSFDELLYIVTRIKSVSNLPLSVDVEAGFGSTVGEIITHLKCLAKLGVVGINLEDSRVVNGVRQLDDAAAFAGTLKEIRNALSIENYQLFLNIRTDTYLLNHEQALQETLLRGQLYEAAGADGFFVPCLTSEKDIETISREVLLPLNIMCMPGLPSFERLGKLGVKRISMGDFVHSAMQSKLKDLMLIIQSQQTFAGVFVNESSR